MTQDFDFDLGFGDKKPKITDEEFVADATEKKASKPSKKTAGSYRHLQAKLTPEEYREVTIHLAHNDITNKQEWLRKLILKEVRGFNEPMESDTGVQGSGDDPEFPIF